MMASSKNYPWILVALLWGVALLNYLDRQMLSTMKSAIMVDITELQAATNFGRLMAVFLWIYAFMSPIAGMIADRISKKKVIVGSLLVWSAVTCMMGFAGTFQALYVLRALMGVSEALYIPASLALIAEYHTGKTRSLAVGIHMTGFYMGQALGGFGATLSGLFNWKYVFLLLGGVGIVYAFLLLFFLQDNKQSKTESSAAERTDSNKQLIKVLPTLRVLFSNTSFWILLLYFAIPSLPGWAIKNWLPTLFSLNLQMDMSIAGPISTITIAGSSLLGVLLGGRLSDKWVVTNLRGRIYTSALGLALTLPALFFLGYGNQVIFAVAAAFCFGVGFGMFDANNMPILCQFVPAHQRATAYGFMNMTGVLAGAFITDFLGKSTDAGRLGKDFAVMAIVVALAVLLQLFFLRPESQDA
jgi:ACS family D-galactonate transporter-like MFS transporter